MQSDMDEWLARVDARFDLSFARISAALERSKRRQIRAVIVTNAIQAALTLLRFAAVARYT